MQFFTLAGSKVEGFQIYFFDIVTTQYDYPRYVKHASGRGSVVFILFGYWLLGGGGGIPRDWYTTCLCSFSAESSLKSKFPKLIFLTL